MTPLLWQTKMEMVDLIKFCHIIGAHTFIVQAHIVLRGLARKLYTVQGFLLWYFTIEMVNLILFCHIIRAHTSIVHALIVLRGLAHKQYTVQDF